MAIARDPFGRAAGDVFEVRGFAADDGAEADHGVEPAADRPPTRAAVGISNAPGTQATVTSSVAHAALAEAMPQRPRAACP